MGSFFFVIPQVFVANPNKPRSIIEALIENRRELLKLLQNLPTSKGEDELDEERNLIIQGIQKLACSSA
jgi:calcium binding protein 39